MVQDQLKYQADVQAYVDRRMNKMMLELNNTPLIQKDKKSWNSFVTGFSKGLAK